MLLSQGCSFPLHFKDAGQGGEGSRVKKRRVRRKGGQNRTAILTQCRWWPMGKTRILVDNQTHATLLTLPFPEIEIMNVLNPMSRTQIGLGSHSRNGISWEYARCTRDGCRLCKRYRWVALTNWEIVPGRPTNCNISNFWHRHFPHNQQPLLVQGSSNRRAPGSVNAAGKLSQK